MDLTVYHSISDLYNSLNLPIEQDLDLAIHFLPDIHHHTPFRSPVFRAEYFSFVFVKQGKGSYIIDDQEFTFHNHTIYFTNPGHIKGFNILEIYNAYIVTLTESFLRENVHPDIFKDFPFLLAETVPPIYLNSNEFDEFERIYLQIYSEHQKESAYKDQILANLFVVLLLKIKELQWKNYDPIQEGDSNSQIVKKFKNLLEQQFTGIISETGGNYHFRVQDYAIELNLHPNYLNHVIKSKTGKTVNDWISSRTFSTAKSLIKNTDLSNKQIAFKLGFSEATHFSRFFKKQANISPSQFKKDS